MDWSDLLVETTRLKKFNPALAEKRDSDFMSMEPGGMAMLSLSPSDAHALVFVNEKQYRKFAKAFLTPVFGHEPTIVEVYEAVCIPKTKVEPKES